MTVQISVKVRDRPCIEDVNTFRSSLNLMTPLAYTPALKFSDTTTVKMPSHELKILNCPYSAVDSKRVKIGVVRKDIPFWRNAHIRNQNDALT